MCGIIYALFDVFIHNLFRLPHYASIIKIYVPEIRLCDENLFYYKKHSNVGDIFFANITNIGQDIRNKENIYKIIL